MVAVFIPVLVGIKRTWNVVEPPGATVELGC